MKNCFHPPVLCQSHDLRAPIRLLRRFSQPASPSGLLAGSLSRPSTRPRFAFWAYIIFLLLCALCVLGAQIQAATVETECRAPGDMKTTPNLTNFSK